MFEKWTLKWWSFWMAKCYYFTLSQLEQSNIFLHPAPLSRSLKKHHPEEWQKYIFSAWETYCLTQPFNQCRLPFFPSCSSLAKVFAISATTLLINNTAKLQENSTTEDAQENMILHATAGLMNLQDLEGLVLKGWSWSQNFYSMLQVESKSKLHFVILTFWISVFHHHPDFEHTVPASCYQYQRVIFQLVHVTKAYVCYVVLMGHIYSSIKLKAVGKENRSLPFYLIWNLGRLQLKMILEGPGRKGIKETSV